MDDADLLNAEKAQRLFLAVFYEGPWGRLSSWFWGIRKDGTIRFEIPDDARGWRWVMSWLGDFCDQREVFWRSRYARLVLLEGKKPHQRWKRGSLAHRYTSVKPVARRPGSLGYGGPGVQRVARQPR